jgi:hypothetical protein
MLKQEKIDAIIRAIAAQGEGAIMLEDYRVQGAKDSCGLELEATAWWLCFTPHALMEWRYEKGAPVEEAISFYLYESDGRQYMQTISDFSDGREIEGKKQDASYGLARMLAEKLVDAAYAVATRP